MIPTRWNMFAFGLFLVIGLFRPCSANDGRNRYQGPTPSLLLHLPGPVAKGTGFRVLGGDKPGGADGDPAFRWAVPHAAALVQVAARHTEQEFGAGKHEMALFDFSAENADTPIGFGAVSPTGKTAPPAGRHPGGSHDGGLNLDLGYYLSSLHGKFLKEDYAACTEHYAAGATGDDFIKKDLHRCIGPADRLDVARQAYFVLELLKINRRDFSLGLLDTGGMDAQVQRAILTQFSQWKEQGKYSVTDNLIGDLQRLFSHDPWDGWASYHHHHLHLRLLASSATGALMAPAQRLISQALRVRGELYFQQYPQHKAYLDAQLLSYKLHRSVQLHLLKTVDIASVRYRIDGGAWMLPHDEKDDQRLTLELASGPLLQGRWLRVEAKLVYLSGKSGVIVSRVYLPKQDPRLNAAYQPGSIHGSVKLATGKLSTWLKMPDALKSLVTSVRYLVYSQDADEPLCMETRAGWFHWATQGQDDGTCGHMGSAKDARFKVTFRLPEKYRKPLLIEAQVIFSQRLRESVPIYMRAPDVKKRPEAEKTH